MKKNLIIKFNKIIKNEGVLPALEKLIYWVIRHVQKLFGFEHFDAIGRRRNQLSKELNMMFNSTVRYGPFKGLRFSDNSWWGASDRGGMLLGIYEEEILNILSNLPKKYQTFIDLGAADGYYGIGVLVGNIFDKSYCFEISNEGRHVIKQNANLNNVSDRLIIEGKADNFFYKSIKTEDIENSFLLIDIEGGEFELLNENVLDVFKSSIIIIEIHDWVEGGGRGLEMLIARAKKTHSVEFFKTSKRDLAKYQELAVYADNDRWILCSEGRPKLMSWMYLKPNNY